MDYDVYWWLHSFVLDIFDEWKSEVEKLFKDFYTMVENQFQEKYVSFILVMEQSILMSSWEIFWKKKEFSINLHVEIPLNKMVLLSIKTKIYSK